MHLRLIEEKKAVVSVVDYQISSTRFKKLRCNVKRQRRRQLLENPVDGNDAASINDLQP